jgi:hypothetical protein
LVDEHGLCADRTTFYSKAQKALASSIKLVEVEDSFISSTVNLECGSIAASSFFPAQTVPRHMASFASYRCPISAYSNVPRERKISDLLLDFLTDCSILMIDSMEIFMMNTSI